MEKLMQGDVALVTGAARGLGLRMAQALAGEGAAVCLSDLDGDGAERAAQAITQAGGTAMAVRLNVTDPAACESAMDAVAARLGPLSVLVNNAGVLFRDDLDSDSFLQEFRQIHDVNVMGIVHMVRAARHQLRQTQGRIVNVASITSFSAAANALGYVSSKGAVAQLTRALAADFAPHGVRVNALAPGRVETDMTAAYRDKPEVKSAYMSHVLIKRYAVPDDLAGPLLFLASGMSGYVTGVVLPVDGGFTAI